MSRSREPRPPTLQRRLRAVTEELVRERQRAATAVQERDQARRELAEARRLLRSIYKNAVACDGKVVAIPEPLWLELDVMFSIADGMPFGTEAPEEPPGAADALRAWLIRSPAHADHDVAVERVEKFGEWRFTCRTCNRITIDAYTGALKDGEVARLLATEPFQPEPGVTRHEHVMGGAWCLEGTRMPTASIYACRAAAAEAYPRLTAKQIQTAIRHEERWQKYLEALPAGARTCVSCHRGPDCCLDLLAGGCVSGCGDWMPAPKEGPR